MRERQVMTRTILVISAVCVGAVIGYWMLFRPHSESTQPAVVYVPPKPEQPAHIEPISEAPPQTPLPIVDSAAKANADARRKARDKQLAAKLDPKLQQIRAEKRKITLEGIYQPLLQRLQLSESEKDAFLQYLVDREFAGHEAVFIAAKEGLTGLEAAKAVAGATQQVQADLDLSAERMLGSDRYSHYLVFKTTIPARSTVSKIQQSLTPGGAAIDLEKSEWLVSVLAEEDAKIPEVGRPAGLEGELLITDTAVRRAKEFLSDVQVSALLAAQKSQHLSGDLARASEEFEAENR